MNFIKYNRAAAWCALIVIILTAIPLGANLSVNRLEKSLIRIYEEDSPRYGSPRADLRRLADYGEQLSSIASAVLGEDASFRDEVDDLRRLGESDPLRQKEAADALFRAASMAYNRIIGTDGVSDSQKQSAIAYFYEMDSTRARLMNHEEFADAAVKYNRAVTSFPGLLSARSSVDIYK